jgi:hypothetical protein
MTKTLRTTFAIFLLTAAGTAVAFDGHIVTEGPLKLTINDIEDVTEVDKPQQVKVTIKNNGQSQLMVKLQMAGLVDEWYAVGETEKSLKVAPDKEADATFQIAAEEGAHSALYPVHIYANFQHQGKKLTAHAVRIFESDFPKQPKQLTSKKTNEVVPKDTEQPISPLTDTQRQKLRNRARAAIKSQKAPGRNEFVFKLKGDCVAAIVLGENGLADAAIAFGNGERCVVFDGLNVSVLRHKVGQQPSQVIVQKVDSKKSWFGELSIKHHLYLEQEEFDLTAKVWKKQSGLCIKLQCPKRITDIAMGQANQKAIHVYYGHGYCIIEPEAFNVRFGGYNLSTSHVGFDFAKDISLLVASDNPPDYLQVDPDQRIYALHTHLDATLTFVPSTKGAFDCARKYRDLFDKKPASGVKRKAGRFVFDIWGGRYAEIAEQMKRMVTYGLTDSMLTIHVWQRWGYDYRLPDIYPPNPQLGTTQDMQKIAEVCREHDIPWGLHDNYIDFYPDANGYSYDHICFTEDGRPVKAWFNKGRDAQSYRWRPDHIMPFVKRNLKLIKPNLKPTQHFVDVFAALECFDFYDRDGNFHSMLETRKCWGQAFSWIRSYLGGNAFTTSEGGHDQLIGYLDGADCQHIQLSPINKRFYNKVPCQDWQRVPWFDAVLHDKFILHGVGYSGIYQGERPRPDHGIASDDYISAEILEGHALMIGHRAFGCDAVRKYWLAQDFIRSIALDTIENVEFAEGDIHRQIITWKSGAQVYVNRSDKDWKVAGKQLPQYGYFARNGQIESSIERINGVIVEQSRRPACWYVNARGFNPNLILLGTQSAKQEPTPNQRWNIKKEPIDFGPIITEGAFRCQLKKNTLIVIPLPDIDPFTVTLRIDKLTGAEDTKVESITAIDAQERNIRSVEFDAKGSQVKFHTRENEFAYQILLTEM